MAKLYIAEYANLPRDANGFTMPIPGVLIAEQTVEIGEASAQSAAINGATRYVVVTADADCHVGIGADPTATTNHAPVWSSTYRDFAVTPGQKIAVIAAANE